MGRIVSRSRLRIDSSFSLLPMPYLAAGSTSVLIHLAADHTPSAQAGPDSELAALLADTTVLGFLPAPPHCLSSQRPGWHRGQDGLSCWPVRPRILFKTISIAPEENPCPTKSSLSQSPTAFELSLSRLQLSTFQKHWSNTAISSYLSASVGDYSYCTECSVLGI